jgi:predicted nucleic acid-binding protein
VKALKEASVGKDARVEELSQDRDAMLKEKASWAEEKTNLEETIGAQFDEGFNFALEQVKILFPDIDVERLGEASALMVIKDGQLVPYVPPSDSTP